MVIIEGVLVYPSAERDCFVCIVEDLSEALKELIRKRLVSICEGEYKAEEKETIYTYKATVKEFLERYETKSENMKKGMIGEFLAHLFVFEQLGNVRSASPFFNLEEKSFTKGFDLVLYNSATENILIVEVKSGETNEHESSKDKNLSLISTAKNDLKTRLSENNQTIWRNAVNKLTVNDKGVRELVEGILEGNFVIARDESPVSTDDDVVLTSVLFNDVADAVNLNDVFTTKAIIDEEGIFKSTIIFSIQKSIYEKVVEFLKEEVPDE